MNRVSIVALAIVILLALLGSMYLLSNKNEDTYYTNIIMKNCGRLEIWQRWPTPFDRNVFSPSERRILTTFNKPPVYGILWGCDSQGWSPYYAYLVQFAYDAGSGNLNVIVSDMGDAPVDVYWDGRLIGHTEEILQDKVFFDNVSALVRGKWLAFNVAELVK
jgi:hypothetical protein